MSLTDLKTIKEVVHYALRRS
ncbi:MAG: hypothetical protein OEX02_12525 [Cyclobacteriaceae bacterium]|nr:hypothetical protein [Cyclobacteriaceae bacterium]